MNGHSRNDRRSEQIKRKIIWFFYQIPRIYPYTKAGLSNPAEEMGAGAIWTPKAFNGNPLPDKQRGTVLSTNARRCRMRSDSSHFLRPLSTKDGV